MAKTRMLKHDLRTSERVASWPIEVRYFWVLLWGYVDDHGKGKDNPLLIKADCFPLDESVTGETIDGWLWMLSGEGVISRFASKGSEWLQVVNWTEHQKPPHPTPNVLPSFNGAESVIRERHDDFMHDAGNAHEDFTPGLGWVGSGFGVGSELSAPLTAGVSFSDFWSIWPRKDKRKDAETAWASAIKRAKPERILQVATEYAQHPDRPARQFVSYGATWLRGDCWDDPMPLPDERTGRPSKDVRALSLIEQGRAMDEARIRKELSA